MEDGRELISSGSLFRMDVTLAPGKQCVVALKERIFLVMLSPTIKVVGKRKGVKQLSNRLAGVKNLIASVEHCVIAYCQMSQ